MHIKYISRYLYTFSLSQIVHTTHIAILKHNITCTNLQDSVFNQMRNYNSLICSDYQWLQTQNQHLASMVSTFLTTLPRLQKIYKHSTHSYSNCGAASMRGWCFKSLKRDTFFRQQSKLFHVYYTEMCGTDPVHNHGKNKVGLQRKRIAWKTQQVVKVMIICKSLRLNYTTPTSFLTQRNCSTHHVLHVKTNLLVISIYQLRTSVKLKLKLNFTTIHYSVLHISVQSINHDDVKT